MEGWIKLHRSLLEWGWYSDPNVSRLFIHVLLKANFKSKNWKKIIVERGSFITSTEVLSNETGLSIQQVRTALKKLELTNEITVKRTNKFTIIKVVNYSLFQELDNNEQQENNNQITKEEQTENNQITIKQQTNNNQITTTKEVKKEKNEKKEENINTLSGDPTLHQQIIDHLNLKVGTSYKANNKSTVQKINARLNEGYKLDDFIAVIDKKCSEWLNDSKQSKYLRPETLFGNKFEGYVNQKMIGEVRGNAGNQGNNEYERASDDPYARIISIEM